MSVFRPVRRGWVRELIQQADFKRFHGFGFIVFDVVVAHQVQHAVKGEVGKVLCGCFVLLGGFFSTTCGQIIRSPKRPSERWGAGKSSPSFSAKLSTLVA